MEWSDLKSIAFVMVILFSALSIGSEAIELCQSYTVTESEMKTLDEPSIARMVVFGPIALDLDQIDAIEVIAFPRAGMTEDHNVVRVWYEDGRSFDVLVPSKEDGYKFMLHLAEKSGI